MLSYVQRLWELTGFYRSNPVKPDHKQFRLITIDPASTADELRCELHTVSLLQKTKQYDDFLSRQPRSTIDCATKTLKAWSGVETIDTFPNPSLYRFQWGDYAALSYVWGNPTDPTSIYVNGVETQITRNLAAALHSFREAGQFGGRFRLWVDALCIDQQNLQERGEQVSMMRTFYSLAWSVVGFLGSEADGSDKAFSLLSTLADMYDCQQRCEELRDDMINRRFRHEPGSWLALNRLMLRPYWERLWILQELAIGGPRMVLICGSKQMTWNTFCRGIGVIHFYLWVARHEGVQLDRSLEARSGEKKTEWDATRSLDHVWKDLWMLTQALQSRTPPIQLFRLLEMANSCKCSDDRDRVYAMLGVMDAKLAAAIQPDYTSTAATVFEKTAKAYISTYVNVELLRDCNLCGAAGAPSWAPDWTWSGRGRDQRPDDFLQPENNDVSMERRPYYADKGLPFVMPRYSDGGCLICQAVLFDAVDGLGCNPEPPGQDPDLVQSQGRTSAFGNFEQVSREVGIALYGGRRRCADDAPVLLYLPLTMDEAAVQFEKMGLEPFVKDMFHYHRWTTWYARNASLRVGGVELREYFTGILADGVDVADYWSAYHAWVRTALAGTRRLVTTAAGRVGWVSCAKDPPGGSHGAAEARRGDVFAVFPGCSTPILLRPFEGERLMYKVVGEAYLQGMMEGEIRNLLARKECQMQDLWLY